MFIRLNSDGRISGVAADSTSLIQYEGSSIVDVGLLEFPSKEVIRSVSYEKQMVDEYGNLMFDEFGMPIYEDLVEEYSEKVSMDKNPDDFSADEVKAFVKQAKIKVINDEYMGEGGIITNLRSTGLILLVNGSPVTAIKTQIAAKTVEMNNKIKGIQNY